MDQCLRLGDCDSQPRGSSGTGQRPSGRRSTQADVNGSQPSFIRWTARRPSCRIAVAAAEETMSARAASSSSSSSFYAQVPSGSISMSRMSSVASNPSGVLTKGDWRFTYQPTNRHVSASQNNQTL
jgi:hypothetical protein